MGLTIRQVLELNVLKDAGARVLAGSQCLDRPVRWVHVAELPDIAHLLKGGELLLTTGMGIASDSDLQCRYLAELADVGIAGLVIELGRSFSAIPAAMVQDAERRGIPLIALDRETRYVEITEEVHRAIISHQYELLRRAEGISRGFTELILGGASIAQVVHRSAEMLGNPVILEDAAHQVVEFAGQGTAAHSVLASWERHSRVGHAEIARGSVRQEVGVPRCIWVGIWLRHQAWGRVHLLETETGFDEITELALDRAGAALGLALLSQKDAANLADRAGSALLSDLLAGRHGSVSEFIRRARSLGADLTRGRLAALAVEPATVGEAAGRSAPTERERQVIRVSVAAEIRRAACERECPALVGLDGGRILAIIAVGESDRLEQVLGEIVETAGNRLAIAQPSLAIVAGASREAVPDSLQNALQEATEALTFGRQAEGGRGVHHFGDLGTYQLLLRLTDGSELARFVESELSPLLQHDAQSSAKLVPTLRAYLAHAGRKSDAVRDLRIQRRTLYGRLERIERILNRDLDTQDTRTRLTLALQGLDLLHDRMSNGRAMGRDSS